MIDRERDHMGAWPEGEREREIEDNLNLVFKMFVLRHVRFK